MKTNNVFTDEDMKRLKEESEVHKRIVITCQSGPPLRLDALLARLDAAESVCQQVEIYITDKTPLMYRMKELLRKWRKAKGEIK